MLLESTQVLCLSSHSMLLQAIFRFLIGRVFFFLQSHQNATTAFYSAASAQQSHPKTPTDAPTSFGAAWAKEVF